MMPSPDAWLLWHRVQDDLRTAFLAYFRVGQPGGKTLKRFDELMQVPALQQQQQRV